jgi:hypothetical protein
MMRNIPFYYKHAFLAAKDLFLLEVAAATTLLECVSFAQKIKFSLQSFTEQHV